MSMRVPFTQVDAFADAAFGGNPAAVLQLDAWPEDEVTFDDPRVFRINDGVWRVLALTSISWLLPVFLLLLWL